MKIIPENFIILLSLSLAVLVELIVLIYFRNYPKNTIDKTDYATYKDYLRGKAKRLLVDENIENVYYFESILPICIYCWVLTLPAAFYALASISIGSGKNVFGAVFFLILGALWLYIHIMQLLSLTQVAIVTNKSIIIYRDFPIKKIMRFDISSVKSVKYIHRIQFSLGKIVLYITDACEVKRVAIYNADPSLETYIKNVLSSTTNKSEEV